MKYELSGDEPGGWTVAANGTQMAFITGPSSGLVALAAVEKLNQDKGFHDGWLGRLMAAAEGRTR